FRDVYGQQVCMLAGIQSRAMAANGHDCGETDRISTAGSASARASEHALAHREGVMKLRRHRVPIGGDDAVGEVPWPELAGTRRACGQPQPEGALGPARQVS